MQQNQIKYQKTTNNYLDFADYRSQVLASIGLPENDTSQDAILETYFKQAQEIVERKYGISLVANTYIFTGILSKVKCFTLLYNPATINSFKKCGDEITNYSFNVALSKIYFDFICCDCLLEIEFASSANTDILLLKKVIDLTACIFVNRGECGGCDG